MIEFDADGRTYSLTFNMKALKAYQRDAGETVLEAFEIIEKGRADAVRLSAMFRAVCQPEVSEEEGDRLIDGLGIVKAMALLGDAATEFFADPSKASRARSTAGSVAGLKRA